MRNNILILIVTILMLIMGIIIFSQLKNKEWNCSDFRTQIQAQNFFKRFATDRYHLDQDHDGIVCENLTKTE